MKDIFTDEKRDLPKVRKTETSERNDFVLKQEGPYGWWKIHRERGPVPDKLDGWYTKPELAQNAINQYVK